MFNRRDTSLEAEERQCSTDRPYPRKFTVSSLIHKLEHRPSEPHIRPSPHLTHRDPLPPHTPSHSQSSYPTRSKENTTPLMLKTINIKISELDHFGSSRHVPAGFELESQFQESPPRVHYRRPLHG